MPFETEALQADNRQRLIRAATEAFMEEGYRASIDRIAARAEVARQTVYNHFASKEDLFSEVANVVAGLILVTLDDERGDIRERLLRFGAALRQQTLGEEGIAMARVFIAEARRFPELARAVLEKGPERAHRRLTRFLSDAMEAGELRRDDPAFAADLLLSMLHGSEFLRRAFGAPPPDAAEEPARTARIIDAFLSIYAPQPELP